MDVHLINYKASNVQTLLEHAFKNMGFVLLTNHSISRELIAENLHAWKHFFTSHEKYYFQYNTKTLDGYFPFGLEKESVGKYRDLKEFYYFYAWGKCPESLKQKTQELFNELVSLGTTLLQYLEDYLPAPIRDQLSMPLVKMVENTPRSVLRLLHYPPLEKFTPSDLAARAKIGAMRASEHEDLTLISLVMPLIGSGLQVKDLAGHWHSIDAGRDHLLINLGDMLEMCTKGFYKATTHRVLKPEGKEAYQSRYANAFFFNPRDEVQLDDEHTALSCLNAHIQKKLAQKEIVNEDIVESVYLDS